NMSFNRWAAAKPHESMSGSSQRRIEIWRRTSAPAAFVRTSSIGLTYSAQRATAEGAAFRYSATCPFLLGTLVPEILEENRGRISGHHGSTDELRLVGEHSRAAEHS